MKPIGKYPIRRPRLRQEQLGKKDVIYKSMREKCEGQGLQRQSQTASNVRQHQSRNVKGRKIRFKKKKKKCYRPLTFRCMTIIFPLKLPLM